MREGEKTRERVKIQAESESMCEICVTLTAIQDGIGRLIPARSGSDGDEGGGRGRGGGREVEGRRRALQYHDAEHSH